MRGGGGGLSIANNKLKTNNNNNRPPPGRSAAEAERSPRRPAGLQRWVAWRDAPRHQSVVVADFFFGGWAGWGPCLREKEGVGVGGADYLSIIIFIFIFLILFSPCKEDARNSPACRLPRGTRGLLRSLFFILFNLILLFFFFCRSVRLF